MSDLKSSMISSSVVPKLFTKKSMPLEYITKLVLSLDAFIASKERIFLWISFWLRLSIFYSFRVCVRQISHVRNERHSENSTTRDWWIIETSLTLLIYHFSDFHLFQDKKLILFWSGRWWKSDAIYFNTKFFKYEIFFIRKTQPNFFNPESF